MNVEIWSDVVCPWCYIGKRRFEQALAQFPHADQVEITWRSFELDPAAPTVRDGDLVTRLATKYGVSIEQAEAMNHRVTGIAAEEGLEYRLDIAKPGNTFDAHRLIHLAHEHGLQGEMKEALLAAYQSHGKPIGDHDALVEVAVTLGLEETEVREVLASDKFGAEVRHDEDEARAFGITGVPFFVFDRTYAVSGAQSPDVLLEVLETAWAEQAPLQVIAATSDHACGPDGCEMPEVV